LSYIELKRVSPFFVGAIFRVRGLAQRSGRKSDIWRYGGAFNIIKFYIRPTYKLLRAHSAGQKSLQ
jgi:hypothetical protein